MALSNWDTISVDLSGKPTNGSFVHDGTNVEVYKNWIYIHDEQAWREGRYTDSCILEIHEGRMSYRDIEISAVRGPQDGIYLACWAYDRDKPDAERLTGMIGCGVYGYEGDSDKWIGVQPASVEFLKKWITRCDPPTSDFFVLDEVIARVDLSKAIRFNQGDAYFADQGVSDLSVTKPGEAGEPVIEQFLHKIFPPKGDT